MRVIIILAFISLFSCREFNEKNEIAYNSKPENPREREEWMWARKGKEATPEKVRLAKGMWDRKFNSQQKEKFTRDGGLNAWEEKGPFGIGGRIRSIAVDPNDNNHIFIGSVGGGLWVTTNGGTIWNPVNDFMASLAITQIMYDPFDSNIMYASTGEGFNNRDALPGLGVFKSTNGGITWNVLPSPLNNFNWVNDIALDPNNRNWIYAVTSNGNSGGLSGNGSIYKSVDGGQSWTLIQNTNSQATDIKIDPDNSENLMVGCSNDAYRITNAVSGPAIFTNITIGISGILLSPGRVELSYCPDNASRIYASIERNGGEIWRSDDQGFTWNQRNSTISPISDCTSQNTSLLPLGWYANNLFVDPSNSNRLIVGSVDLYRSTNGGDNFNRITSWCDDINGNSNGNNNSIHADHHVIIPFNNYNGNTNNNVFICNDGGVYSNNNIWTADTTSGWISLQGNVAITQFYGGSISSDGQTIIGGAQDNSFSLSSDGGTSWSQPTTGDGAYAVVNYNDDQIIYANTNNNNIRKTIDGGANWNRIANFGCGTCSVAGFVNNGIFSVRDNARLISKFLMDPNDPDILVACAQRLWRNTDAGDPNDWSSIKAAIGTNIWISAVDIDYGNSARIWAGYDNGRLERTTNTGSSWSGNINPSTTSGITLPASPFVTDIAINPNNSNEVIVSYGGYNTNNLFYTSNGNDPTPTWSNINTGIPIQINTVEWHPSNSNWIYVGTDFGILASEDKGQNWSITPLYSASGHDGPVNTEVSELFWQPTTTRLCAATFGRGIWRSNPIKDKIYVDKNHSCGLFGIFCLGTYDFPYDNFKDALSAAGHGSEIIFLSDGIHEEVNNTPLVIKKRIKLSLDNGGNSVIIE